MNTVFQMADLAENRSNLRLTMIVDENGALAKVDYPHLMSRMLLPTRHGH